MGASGPRMGTKGAQGPARPLIYDQCPFPSPKVRPMKFTSGFSATLLGLALVMPACASTQIHSQADPAAAGHRYENIMVVVDMNNLGLRQDTERRFEEQTRGRRTHFIASHRLLFPGRHYSKDEVRSILAAAHVDAVLAVHSANSGTNSMYVPPTTKTEGSAEIQGDKITGSSTTTTSGGYTLEAPWANFTAELRVPETREPVWIATMSTGGNVLASWRHVVRSMAGKTANQLVKDGIVR
jgi:hypothetical protein